MIYQFLKRIIKIALFFYFKKIVVSGKENIPEEGPMIIVANHPNTLLDPLIIAALTKHRIGFLANAGIFSNAILAKILTFFHVIPIYRKKDIAPGEKPDNKFSFLKCFEYLDKKGTILIFPEGTSYYELKLREIKTGTARIALSYEQLKDFKSDLKIVPIALDYSDSIQFRSVVSITINEPISVQDYQNTYEEKQHKGVLALTEKIQKELEKHIPNTSNKEQEQFLIQTHKFYTTIKDPNSNLKLNPKQSLEFRKQISNSMNLLKENNSELYNDTHNKIYLFFNTLKKEGLAPGFFSKEFYTKNRNLVCVSYILKFLILAPIYIYGLLTNYIPYILPSKIFKLLKLEIEYKTSIQMIVGLFTFPIFYWLNIKVIGHYIALDFWTIILFLVSFPISGLIALFYAAEISKFKRILHFYFFMKPVEKTNLYKLRDEILKNIDIAQSN